jgi:hypothetical protein
MSGRKRKSGIRLDKSSGMSFKRSSGCTSLKMKGVDKNLDGDQEIKALGVKLDSLEKVLKLHPYDTSGQFQGQLQPISYKLI